MCDVGFEPIGDIVERLVNELASARGGELGPMPLSAGDHLQRQALERSFHSTDGAYQRQARRLPRGTFFTCAGTVVCGRWVHSIASDDHTGIAAARHSAEAELELVAGGAPGWAMALTPADRRSPGEEVRRATILEWKRPATEAAGKVEGGVEHGRGKEPVTNKPESVRRALRR